MMPEEILETYSLEGGIITVSIIKNSEGGIMYRLNEKAPDDRTIRIVHDLTQQFLESSVSEETVEDFLRNKRKTMEIGPDIIYYIFRYSLGLLEIEPLMHDPRIEDISCDGPGIPVFVFLKEYGYIASNIIFDSEEFLDSYVRRLAQAGGKQISASSPIVESTLPDGSRIQASIGRFITTRGPSFSIRRFREIPMSPLDLVDLETASPELMAYLWTIIQYGSNIMVVGGTASGKTTFLNALLSFIPSDRKIVTIEDTRELNLGHQNWIATVTRIASGTDEDSAASPNQISMFDLLESSLRHRPNYIVLGEVRGPETFTVFQAMSAGRFGMGTFHADDVSTFIHRLESRPINIPRNLLISLDTVIVLKTGYARGRLRRYVSEADEIVGLDSQSGDIITNTFFRREQDTFVSSEYSYVVRRIATREGLEERKLIAEIREKTKILQRMQELGIVQFQQAFQFFSLYSRDREKAIKILNI